MITKLCKNCGFEKSFDEFNKCVSRSDGVGFFCKICANEISKKWYKDNSHKSEVMKRLRNHADERRKTFKACIDKIKSSCGCAICEESEPTCLDFHHVFGEKDRDVSYFVKSKSFDKIRKELEKCICVCSNCHRKIHSGVLKVNCLLLHQEKRINYSYLDCLETELVRKPRADLGKMRSRKLFSIECGQCKKEFLTGDKKRVFCGNSCARTNQRKVVRPSKDELISLIEKNPITKIGAMFNVSDNAVRKWAKVYGIDIKTSKK